MQNINSVIYGEISVLYTRTSNKELKQREITWSRSLANGLTYPLRESGVGKTVTGESNTTGGG